VSDAQMWSPRLAVAPKRPWRRRLRRDRCGLHCRRV